MKKSPKIKITMNLGRNSKLCPVCLDQLHNPDPISSLTGWFTPEEFQCKSCGYVGTAVVEPRE